MYSVCDTVGKVVAFRLVGNAKDGSVLIVQWGGGVTILLLYKLQSRRIGIVTQSYSHNSLQVNNQSRHVSWVICSLVPKGGKGRQSEHWISTLELVCCY